MGLLKQASKQTDRGVSTGHLNRPAVYQQLKLRSRFESLSCHRSVAFVRQACRYSRSNLYIWQISWFPFHTFGMNYSKQHSAFSRQLTQTLIPCLVMAIKCLVHHPLKHQGMAANDYHPVSENLSLTLWHAAPVCKHRSDLPCHNNRAVHTYFTCVTCHESQTSYDLSKVYCILVEARNRGRPTLSFCRFATVLQLGLLQILKKW